MTNMIEISEEAFTAPFRPQANHLNPNAGFDWGDGFGTLYETYDAELEFIRSLPINRVWTLLSGDEGDFIAGGFHFVNRLGYFVTESMVPDGLTIHVVMPQVWNDADLPEISPRVLRSIRAVVNYLWADEHSHYESSDPCDRRSHIFRSIKTVHRWLGSNHLQPVETGDEQ